MRYDVVYVFHTDAVCCVHASEILLNKLSTFRDKNYKTYLVKSHVAPPCLLLILQREPSHSLKTTC